MFKYISSFFYNSQTYQVELITTEQRIILHLID